MQFNLLTGLGLRDYHKLLDIGCGSLRAGRLFIPFLNKGCYYGIEPEKWLLKEGIRKNVGRSLISLRRPQFSHDTNFSFGVFGCKFDFILAQSIFSHATQKQIKRCLSEAAKVMHPESIFAATFVKGDKNYEGDEWVYPGCVQFQPSFMNELAKEAGLSMTINPTPHPNGQTWMTLKLL